MPKATKKRCPCSLASAVAPRMILRRDLLKNDKLVGLDGGRSGAEQLDDIRVDTILFV